MISATKIRWSNMGKILLDNGKIRIKMKVSFKKSTRVASISIARRFAPFSKIDWESIPQPGPISRMFAPFSTPAVCKIFSAKWELDKKC